MIRPFSRFPRRTFNSLAAVAGVLGYLLLGLHWRSDDSIVLSIVHAAGVLLLLSGVIAVFEAAAQPSKNSAFGYYTVAAACFAGIAVGIAVIVGVIPQSAAVIGTDSLSYRDWFLSGKPDLLVLLSCLLLGLLLAIQFGGLEKRDFGLFAGAAAALTLVTNACWLGIGDFSVLMSADAPGYLYRNGCRTPGYLALLTPFKHFDARWVVFAQLNILLASQIALAWSVLRLTSSVLAGVLVLALLIPCSQLISSSFFIGPEPFFAAAFAVAAAASISYLRSPSMLSASAFGLAVTAALGLKAVAPAMLVAVPFLLLRKTPDRRRMAVAMLMPPLLGLCALSAIGRISNGSWGPTTFGGYALAENVAWGIRSDELSSEPELSAAMEANLRDRQNAWPSAWNPIAYLSYSTQHLDAMFWGDMMPIVSRHYGFGGGAPSCPPQVNQSLMALGKEAVRRDPLRYLVHSDLQFYGLWDFALVPQPWSGSVLRTRQHLGMPMSDWYWRAAPVHWKPSSERLVAIGNAGSDYGTRRLFIDDAFSAISRAAAALRISPSALDRGPPSPIQTEGDSPEAIAAAIEIAQSSPRELPILPGLGLVFLVFTVALAALASRLSSLSSEIAALTILSIQINAYFAAQAMFMFATPRYSSCVEAPLAAVIAILGNVVWSYAFPSSPVLHTSSEASQS